jgi:signal transduction histidine kinase
MMPHAGKGAGVRSGDRSLLLDPRVGAATLVTLACAASLLPFANRDGLALAAAALLPGALVHLALAFPPPPPIVHSAPGTALFGYAICAVPALMAVRAAGRFDAATQTVVAIDVLLLGLALLLVLVRIARSRPVIGSGPAEPDEVGGGERISSELSFDLAARGVAHAMLKPLAAARERLEAVSPRLESAALQRELEGSISLMGQLERLVRDLVDLARARERAVRRPIPLAKLVEQAVAEVRQRLPGAEVEVEVGDHRVRGDEAGLRRLLVNLVENALEADPGQQWAAVRVSGGDSSIRISVEDRGAGVPEHLRHRVFDPFFTTKQGGTGLGLSLAQEVCRALGGSVVVEATSSGARFVVELPRDGHQRPG